jgi:peptidoglycan lytic transglycosylase
MARVPVIVENEQRLRPLTPERYDAGDTTVVGRAIGAGLQRAGQALSEKANIDDQINATYDEARAKQLDNEYQEFERNLLFGDGGFYTKRNADALNARDPTTQAINSQIATLTGKAQTPRERDMLTNVLNRRRQDTLTGIGRYSQGQALSYAKVQSSARIDNATNNFVLFADDPERGPAELATIRSEVSAQASLLGLQDAGVIKAMTSDALSKAYAGVVDAKAVNDPIAAMKYLEANRDEIDAATQLRLDRQLHPALVERDANGLADMAVGEPGPMADAKGPLLPRMTNIVLGLEGGGSLAAPKVSPKGARGPMQVMPGTNIDPGYGVRPAANDSEAERARVGRDYLAAMMAKYGNDPARALAAYNGGPGRVDEAIRKNGSNWLAAMPKETRDYVANGMAKLGGSAGSSQGNASGDLGAQLATVDRIARDRGMTDETRLAARAEVERRYALGKRVEADREDAAKDSALESVMALGDNFTSTSQIPNFAKLSPETRLQFTNWAKSNVQAKAAASAKRATDSGKWSILSDAYASDPKTFLAIRPEQVRPFLDDGDFNTYLGWRRDVLQDTRAGGSGKTPQWTTEKDIMDVSRTLLNAAGLRTGESKDAIADAPRVAQFNRTMLGWSQSFKQQNGRLPNSEEIRKQADRYLIEGTWKTPGRLWGSNTNDGFAFEAPNQALSVKVPDAVRKRILAAAPDASDQEIATIYVRGKGTKW